MEKGEKTQANTLIYTTRAEADNVLQSFKLLKENQKKYAIVKNLRIIFYCIQLSKKVHVVTYLLQTPHPPIPLLPKIKAELE